MFGKRWKAEYRKKVLRQREYNHCNTVIYLFCYHSWKYIWHYLSKNWYEEAKNGRYFMLSLITSIIVSVYKYFLCWQVILVASSFMSPIESRNSTNTNRVRMFGPSDLSKTAAEQKWDRVKLVCTQPFNKVQYSCKHLVANWRNS